MSRREPIAGLRQNLLQLGRIRLRTQDTLVDPASSASATSSTCLSKSPDKTSAKTSLACSAAMTPRREGDPPSLHRRQCFQIPLRRDHRHQPDAGGAHHDPHDASFTAPRALTISATTPWRDSPSASVPALRPQRATPASEAAGHIQRHWHHGRSNRLSRSHLNGIREATQRQQSSGNRPISHHRSLLRGALRLFCNGRFIGCHGRGWRLPPDWLGSLRGGASPSWRQEPRRQASADGRHGFSRISPPFGATRTLRA